MVNEPQLSLFPVSVSWVLEKRLKVESFDPSPVLVATERSSRWFEEPGALLKWTGWRADMAMVVSDKVTVMW